ncbi:MAG TPA: SCO1664 family protein [Actinomycetota bacterium]|nr:SCO1664 family protein [Actinomycetota bacterium]
MPRDERPSGLIPAGGEVLDLLAMGSIGVLGVLPGSSNFTFLARVEGDGLEALAVYKPREGESPLWDFPLGTLHRREVAAFVVARFLGWPTVPPTLLRDGPAGPGSVQLFVEFDPDQHYFTLHEDRGEDFREIAAFDVVVNNADRKAGHCLLGRDGRIFAIDHGTCFNVDPKLRTVVWDFVGEAIPDRLLEDVAALANELRAGDLRATLGDLLGPDEIDATARRAEGLVAEGRFPGPGPGRPFPWPVV